MKCFIGIDPGATGGICVIDEADRLLLLESCPKTIKGQWEALCRAMACLTGGTYSSMPDGVCAIENVHSMPKQGVRSTWTFSGNYHAWLMALVAAQIPYQQVSPQRWMQHFGAMPAHSGTMAERKRKRKHRLLHFAEQRYPSTKITLNMADAVLLAVYAKEQIGQLTHE